MYNRFSLNFTAHYRLLFKALYIFINVLVFLITFHLFSESTIHDSEHPVATKITTVGQLLLPLESAPSPPPFEDKPTSSSDATVLEGWQLSWDQGMYPPNVCWLKSDGPHGIFQPTQEYTTAKGIIGTRQLFKKRMDFSPPPLTTTVAGLLPPMLSFFTTPVFFWRPVGVMDMKIKCPNSRCPAPPNTYLTKSGYGNIARQVCGMQYDYTLLTERLKCNECQRARQKDTSDDPLQYRWHAYSPSILLNLAPAIRSMFPAVICGKRAIDKSVVTLLTDRLNAVSMTKVQRMVRNGHDEWYAERRDLYQSLLYQAHTAGKSSSSQRGILSYTNVTYTPPMQASPLPSPRVIRRAHLMSEMEKMPVYRASILSTTGEILCIDGTKQVICLCSVARFCNVAE